MAISAAPRAATVVGPGSAPHHFVLRRARDDTGADDMILAATLHRLDAGDTARLGARAHRDGVNFAVVSEAAERIELCIFTPDARREVARMDLPTRHGEVWAGFLPGARPGLVYGYRVHGPYAPERGQRFNPHKLLLDPYATRLAGRFAWGPEHYGYRLESGRPSGALDRRDNAATAWKAVVADPAGLAPLAPGPRRPMERTVLYEAHVRGFTIRHPEIPEGDRGRFAGLAAPAAIEYLKALGVTAVELLPVHAFLKDQRLVDQGLSNFWGYNTLSYFAPHPAYCGPDPIGELRAFVDALHDAGLEVILDVVYNHTCEGDERGPTVSFRGFDNALYYRLRPEDPSRYADISGCGSTLDATKPAVRRLILDSLEHWTTAYGIDGFRFDIATSLGLGRDGRFHTDAPLFAELRARPALADVKLIAEAWDAAGGFHVGDFPRGWSEWNAKARDSFRKYWRGDTGEAAEFARRFSGSADLYLAKGRPGWSSVNYIACHDGFTTADLTAYSRKHNLANREDNRDGPNENYSNNFGHEGPTDDPARQELRDQQARNLLATALLAFGTPMLLAGDEILRSQGGNNNAYNQDNPVSWLDWPLADSPRGAAMRAFVARVLGLRADHDAYDSDHFPAPPGHDGSPVMRWLSSEGADLGPDDWSGLDGQPLLAAIAAPGRPIDRLIVFHPARTDARFTLPAIGPAAWACVLDTADGTLLQDPGPQTAPQAEITISALSLRVYVALRAQSDQREASAGEIARQNNDLER